MDTFEKLEYKIKAGLKDAQQEKEYRLSNRFKIDLPGLHQESLYITGMKRLVKRSKELVTLYDNVPESFRVASVVLLDAHSSATIEGAHTTVDRMRQCLQNPESKDEIMVANTYKGCMFAYDNPITKDNIRKLWDIIVDGVCENSDKAGTLYRNGMVFIGNENRNIHTPAKVDQLPDLMNALFDFDQNCTLDPLIKSFVYHFYFVYVHPFCDGNGRTARTINNSQLYFSGFSKVKSLAMATAINRDLDGYYRNITDCEKVIDEKKKEKWLDLSPFIEYMQNMFENSITDAVLANNELSESERKLLDRMNKTGIHAEITVKNAVKITQLSESGARKVLNSLANKGYLYIDKSRKTFIYRLSPHI